MKRNWTQEETEFLCENWGSLCIPTLAEKLDRSKNAIIVKVQRLGLGPYLESGEYITFHQLVKAVTGTNYGYMYKLNSWGQKRGLPIRRKKINSKYSYVVYLKDFWPWAKTNRSFIDFSQMEPFSLGKEPDWVAEQRKKDFKTFEKQRKWTPVEDSRLIHLVKQYKYTYSELSEIMHRTDGAIQRRLVDLKIKERPLRARVKHWKEEEHQILLDGIKKGDSYMAISQKIGRSEKAVRGHVYQTYGTEAIDKVRQMVGTGQWGDGSPTKRAAENAVTLPTAEAEPHITPKQYHNTRRISSDYL